MEANRHKKANVSIYIVLTLVACLWGAAGFLGASIQRDKPDSWKNPKPLYLPEPGYAKLFSLGYHQFLASYMWVNSILYFSTAFLEGKPYPWLGKMLLNIQVLDPKFKAVYHYGTPMLGEDLESKKMAKSLFLKGVREFPRDFRLRLYAAMSILNLDSNYLEASRVLAPIMENPDAPQYMKNLGLTIIQKKYNSKFALNFLLTEYAIAQSPIYREKLFQKICSLGPLSPKAEAVVKILLEAIEQDQKTQKTVEKMLFLIIFKEGSQEAEKILESFRAPGLK